MDKTAGTVERTTRLLQDEILSLKKELLRARQAHLQDVERDIQLVSEILFGSGDLKKKDTPETDVGIAGKYAQLQMEHEALQVRITQLEEDVDRLQWELLQSRQAHLSDVENDIQALSQTLFGISDDNEESNEQKWKQAYEDLAHSKLGRIQRFYWGLRSPRKKEKA